MKKLVLVAATAALIATAAAAQDRRPRSPSGESAAQVLGSYDVVAGNVGGQWIDIKFGRPLRRGRDLFGPADFVEMLNDGAEIWRAGANYTTRLIAEVPLRIAGVDIAPGEYSVFIELSREQWTFVLSTWPAQKVYDYENKDALFGAFYYTADRDVLRTAMDLEQLPRSFEQLSWQFVDMTPRGGRLALLWDHKLASVPFEVVGP
ncbi:MAG: DUF2911 domain-containing protein [Acidobacteriota bacterium]|nr:DUF2911 domain-containing protein [Acidobacteriota bacterium]